MLRCGQMILAEALVRRHLGKGTHSKYVNINVHVVSLIIITTFTSKKSKCYAEI